jgi:hypothetical protein
MFIAMNRFRVKRALMPRPQENMPTVCAMANGRRRDALRS